MHFDAVSRHRESEIHGSTGEALFGYSPQACGQIASPVACCSQRIQRTLPLLCRLTEPIREPAQRLTHTNRTCGRIERLIDNHLAGFYGLKQRVVQVSRHPSALPQLFIETKAQCRLRTPYSRPVDEPDEKQSGGCVEETGPNRVELGARKSEKQCCPQHVPGACIHASGCIRPVGLLGAFHSKCLLHFPAVGLLGLLVCVSRRTVVSSARNPQRHPERDFPRYPYRRLSVC